MRFLLLTLILAPVIAHAFPPAPGIIVYGLVRNADGWPVDGPSATIHFLSAGREIASSTIDSDRAFGENYRALIPIDMKNASGAYRPGVLQPDLPFTVEVRIGDHTFIPIEASVGLDTPGDAGTVLSLDFTLGSDTDADGLPDEWEYWQLQNAGIGRNSPDFSLDLLGPYGDFDRDGLSDLAEYHAGTYAYLGSDKLELDYVDLGDDGWLHLEFLAIIDKAYQFEAASDLLDWHPVAVSTDSDRTTLTTSYRAPNTRVLRISIPPAPSNKARQFRVGVR